MLRSDDRRSLGPADIEPELRLRRMHPHDLEQVMVIERTFTAPWTRDMFLQELHQNDFSDSLVGVLEDLVVGYVLWWYVVDEAHIVNVAVHESQRRRGIARKLLHEVFARGRKLDMSIATLEVRIHNDPAIRLYESLGFRQVAIRKGYYADNGEDALVMLKSLRDPT